MASLCTFLKGKIIFGNFLGVAEGGKIGRSVSKLLWRFGKVRGQGRDGKPSRILGMVLTSFVCYRVYLHKEKL